MCHQNPYLIILQFCLVLTSVGCHMPIYHNVVLVLFAGLRTLCVAMTTISPDVYKDWKELYYKASTSLQNREKKLEEAAELIEQVGGNDVILVLLL